MQFCYGGDGLDPMTLEGDIIPVEFERNLKHIKVCTRYNLHMRLKHFFTCVFAYLIMIESEIN